MSNKCILECAYTIVSKEEQGEKWDKAALYHMLDSVLSKNTNSIQGFISLCYSEIENASSDTEGYKWKLLLECLQELEKKK
ncbi:MAG: hypothetical protein J1E62_10395 [Lachnospiraceae bacterium]|nr:hypothetical protein [Lachnospiraceae bacterium]